MLEPLPRDSRESGLDVDVDVDTAFDATMAPFDGLNDMDWLGTIDWTQGSWMDFN